MFLDVRVQGLTQRALLDDGASACFIDRDFVLEHGLQTVPVPPLQILLGDNSPINANEAIITELRLAQGVRFRATLYVMSLGPATVILGQPFYTALNIKVDYGPARSVTFPSLPNRKAITLPTQPAPAPQAGPPHLATLTTRQMDKVLRRTKQSREAVELAFIHLRVSN
jgi:hypothetical protein